MNGRLFIMIYISSDYIIVYDPLTDTIERTFETTLGSSYPTDMVVSTRDYIYLTWTQGLDTFFNVHRAYYTEVYALENISNSSFALINGTTTYTVQANTGNLLLMTTHSINYNASQTPTLANSGISSARSFLVILWNADHYEYDIAGGVYMELFFNWTCKYTTFVPSISFNLVSVDGYGIPSWAQLDAVNQRLWLNNTAIILSPFTYRFGLKAAWGTEEAIKKFFITILP
jgi:hypothetical protein